jgi:hypothetical protein
MLDGEPGGAESCQRIGKMGGQKNCSQQKPRVKAPLSRFFLGPAAEQIVALETLPIGSIAPET